MYLSYSGFNTDDKCPSMYWHEYVAKTVPPKADNRVNTLYGSIVGVSFEQFYNERMWNMPDYKGVMLSRLDEIAQKVVAEQTRPGRNATLDWNAKESNYHSMEEVLVDVRETIPRGLASIRYHRIVGQEARAEVKLDSLIGLHKIAGRADFIVRRVPPDEDLVIVDGKGSRTRHENVDKRQLRWYSMLYREQHGVLPDKAGFLYWRSEPEAAVDWVEVTPLDADILRATVLDKIANIEDRLTRVSKDSDASQIDREFPPLPSKDCKWCAFLSACPEGTRFMKSRGKAPLPVLDDVGDGSGVDDIGL